MEQANSHFWTKVHLLCYQELHFGRPQFSWTMFSSPFFCVCVLFSFQNYLTAKNMFSHCPASVSPPNRRCRGKVKMLSDRTSISKPVCQEPVGANAADWLTLTVFQTIFVCLRHSHKVSRVARQWRLFPVLNDVPLLCFSFSDRRCLSSLLPR